MTLASEVRSLLAPDGRLAQRWPRYEDRESQRRMACDVARTLEQGGVLLAEAPTGVGKSLAYLLPSVLAARDTDRRVVIATCTKSLQDQLFERDLPALLEALGLSLPCARLKGKQNYLCPKSLEVADSEAAEERAVLESLRRWAADEEIGDLDRFAAEDEEAWRRIRGRVATDPVACSGAACRRGRECFWVRARRRAGEARLLIVNHALLALSGEAEGLLPEFDMLIVDEAHRLEGVLLGQLERSVSRHRVEEALRVLGARAARRPASPGGLLARVRGYLLPLFDGERREGLRGDVDRSRRRAKRPRRSSPRSSRRRGSMTIRGGARATSSTARASATATRASCWAAICSRSRRCSANATRSRAGSRDSPTPSACSRSGAAPAAPAGAADRRRSRRSCRASSITARRCGRRSPPMSCISPRRATASGSTGAPPRAARAPRRAGAASSCTALRSVSAATRGGWCSAARVP
ncbi:MAG: DEAD/DEAH box helicase [Candidatus Eisenbacteria bacterium]|uniref:DNA 5'-3' helicase n=1 Tax=Eiseniibacteriota bacterium TaxID=2212470 RepID=A0A9D6QHZ6_UNCEI|nr:DEAD/DEAH box helicase [Candidatus Eisenbacteria bacterium]